MFRILLTVLVFYSTTKLLAGSGNQGIRYKELPLKEFSSTESQKVLLRYFLSNPSWDVREERGKTFAYKKTDHLEYSKDGYYKDTTGSNDIRLLVSFSGRLKDRQVSVSTEIGNKSQKIKIQCSKTDLSTYPYQSYLIIKDSTFSIEIFEASKTQKRNLTIKVLDELRLELNSVLAHSEEIKKNGFITTPSVLPSDTSLSISEISKGEFLLSGSFAFTEKGHIYAKITSFNGETISGKINRMNSKRPVGWSEQGLQRFRYQTVAINMETPPDRTTMANIEIIFINTKGVEKVVQKKEQVLLSAFSRR